ncbi:MAG: VWA domain-containing protein, partial [Deltaproteobacteria bacterium]|nr:VWA domain-containing protein [Deltaproteobacteria bacterium]
MNENSRRISALLHFLLLFGLVSGCGKAEEKQADIEKPKQETKTTSAVEAKNAPVEAILLEPGKTAIFDLDASGNTAPKEAKFRTRHDGKRYHILKVSVAKEKALLRCESSQEFGKLKVFYNKSREIYARDGAHTLIDDIPQLPGEYNWKLELYGKTPAQKVSVELLERHPLPPTIASDRLGAIRVKGVGLGRATAVPDHAAWGGLRHTDMQGGRFFEADKTPEGDALFWLPPGLWTVTVTPDKSLARRAKSVSAQLVPVKPNTITVLDLPRLRVAEPAAGEGTQVKIQSVEGRAERGVMRLSLLGKDDDKVLPTKANLQIFEGRRKGRVLKVEHPESPLNLVILLDSSGSMKGQMKAVVQAATEFVRALPAGAQIQVVDFDTKPKLLKAGKRPALLKLMSAIRANGATSLNDSVLLGLEMLKDKERAALIVFTDGYDANHNDTGPGSKATPEEMFTAVGKTAVPIFSIGYGKKPDTLTLARIADLSGGLYYGADQASLDEVFKRINVNLGNTFDITYQRPEQGGSSDVPVVAIVVDNSGSMNKNPSRKGCDYRLQKVKRLLHTFVESLPENAVAQITGFNEENSVFQAATQNKAELARGISRLQADGGTNILGATEHAWETLTQIPSSRRFLVFITDAALEVEKAQKEKFKILLGKLKDRGITCLWIGILSDPGEKGPFEYAATLSGGEAVVTANPDDLKAAFDRVSTRVTKLDEEPAGETAVKVLIQARRSNGQLVQHSDSGMFDLSAPKAGAGIEVPNVITMSFEDMPGRYGFDASSGIYGDDQPLKDVRLLKRIPLDVEGRNDAVSIHLDELYLFSRFRGIEAQQNQRFVAARMTLTNILPAQKVAIYPGGSVHPASWVGRPPAGVRYAKQVPPYLVRDLASHLTFRWNQGNETRISKLTWISEDPLMTPRDSAVMVPPGEKVTGTVMFVAEGGELHQASLHFYDTAYGHIDLPLVGAIPKRPSEFTKLPTASPGRLSDAFTLRATAVTDSRKLLKVETPENQRFRVVDLDLVSKVQANLNFDASERVLLRIPTADGPLLMRPEGIGAHIPMGFHGPMLLAPGSHNRVRLTFTVPAAFSGKGSLGDIVVELKDKDTLVSLDEVKRPPRSAGLKTIPGDGIDLTINRIGLVKKLDGRSTDLLAVDFTLADKKDGQSTLLGNWLDLRRDDCPEVPAKTPVFSGETVDRGHKGLRRVGQTLKENRQAPAGQKTRLWPDPESESRQFAMTSKTIIPDGLQRRSVLLFENPFKQGKDHSWSLRSNIFTGLNLALDDQGFLEEEAYLLTKKFKDKTKHDIASFEDKLAKVLNRLQHERRARGWVKPGRVKRISVDPTGGMEAAKAELPVPAISFQGAAKWRAIKNLDTLLRELEKLEFKPAMPGPAPKKLWSGQPWDCAYAPEAVFTQGWGSENDFAWMVAGILKRQGLEFESMEWPLSDAGRKEIEKMAGRPAADPIRGVPGVRYDEGGTKKTLVLPFLKTAEELAGLLEGEQGKVVDPGTDLLYSVKITLHAEPRKGSAKASKADAATALAGGASGKTKAFIMLDLRYTGESLSRGAVDIGYAEMASKDGMQLVAMFDGPAGRVMGNKAGFDPKTYRALSETIEIRTPDGERIPPLELAFEGSVQPIDRFHSLGLNLPDLSPEAVEAMEKEWKKLRAEVPTEPDDLSILKWYTRSLFNRFIAMQSRNERQQAKRLGVSRGRSVRGRVLIASVERDGEKGVVRTHLDLRRAGDQIYAAEPRAARAYAIQTGIYDAHLEAQVLSEAGAAPAQASAIGIFEEASKKGLLMVTDRNRSKLVKLLEEHKFAPAMVKRIRAASAKTLLFPFGRAEVNGRQRLAWLEFDPKTYEVLAVLDTGGHGAATERTLLDSIHDAASYAIGFFVGIDASVWGVSAFSLQEADYEVILAKAQAFASTLADRFSGIGTDPRWSF